MAKHKKKHTKAMNPFEIHINKEKMRVLGKKDKNDRGIPGVARAKAIKKRKSTLLEEYKIQNKSNKFTDKRIGERNKHITGEDRAMVRYAAIRRKSHKKSIFNLADDEILTHRGQRLDEIENFNDPRSDDEDSLDENDKSGKLDSNFVKDAHFGGGILRNTGKEGAKTHKELIEQLISESKKRKAEKQRINEATMELTEKLDTEWKDLLPVVNKSKRKDEDKDKEKEKPKLDEYDRVMRELKFEARGTVSDRLKTDEEIAEEEQQQIEKFEQERLKRMNGFSNDKETKFNHRSADDLDDDITYESDPDYLLSYNSVGESNFQIDAHINGKKLNDEKEASGDENEASGDENESTGDEICQESSEEMCQGSGDEMCQELGDSEENKKEENVQSSSEESVDDDLADLKFESGDESDVEDNIQNIPNNEDINHEEMDLQLLLKEQATSEGLKDLNYKYFRTILIAICSKGDVKQCLNIFSTLIPDFNQLNQEEIYNSMKKLIKGKHEEYNKNPKNYPGLEILIILKVVSLLFSTSDFKHQIVTPCFIFIEQMLNKCKIKSRKDISFGLFLVTLILEYTNLSKRYLPASLNYLKRILYMAIPRDEEKKLIKPQFNSKSNFLVLIKNDQTSNEIPLLKLELNDLLDGEIDENFKIRTIYTTLKLLEEFDNNLKDYPSNIEIFNPIYNYLKQIPLEKYPNIVQKQFETLTKTLENRKSMRNLNFLVTAAQKPKALRLYEPRIEEIIFDGKRHKIRSKEKAEREKLLYKIKKERKGAMREIRRDKAFLGAVKIRQQIQSDKERRDKVKRIYAEAAIQQNELKTIDRKKKKK